MRGWLLAGLAVLAGGLHSAHLLVFARAEGCDSPALICPVEARRFTSGDFHTYRSVALRIRERGLLGASYLRRTPGYPLLLLSAHSLTGEWNPARWLGPPLAAAAAAALAWLAAGVTGRARTAVLTGLLFCAWPGAYALSAALRPDGIHAFLAVVAVAATLQWRRRAHGGVALLAGVLWIAVQSLRPTFFPLALLLPCLLWSRGRSRRYVRVSLLLWLASLPLPAAVIGSNWVRHGVAAPSHVLAVNLACYSVPRLKQELGLGDFHSLRSQCWSRWRGMSPRLRVPAQLVSAGSFLALHPGAAAASFAREIAAQLTHPSRPYSSDRQAGPYPGWWEWGPLAMGAFWICAGAGLYRVTLREPALALFLVLAGASVMLPAATSHLVGARLRLPVELLFLPVAVVAADSFAAALGGRLRRTAAPPSPPSGRVARHPRR